MARNRLASFLMTCLLILVPLLLTPTAPVAQAAGPIYVVNTTSDDIGGGACAVAASTDCSFRSALTKAALTPDSVINFSGLLTTDPGYNAGQWTIRLDSPLPQITKDKTVINGKLIAGLAPFPAIVLDGTTAGTAPGLRVGAAAVQISRLELRKFTGGAIQVQNSAGSTLKSLSLYGNTSYGIEIGAGSSATTLGGTGVGEQVVIGGTIGGLNSSALRLIGGSFGTTLTRSYIGFSLGTNGFTPNLNDGNGILVEGSKDNTIGGVTGIPSPGSIISNNLGNGVLITAANGLATSNNTIASNYIGVGFDGLSDAGNGESGVRIESGATGNTIIGSSDNHMVIAFNDKGGVRIDGDTTSGNRVLGAFIGVNDNGATAANDLGGVLLTNGANGNTVGDTGQGNVIAGNTGYGVYIGALGQTSATATLNAIKANIIGLNSSSTAALPNTNAGIYLADGAKQTVIGAAGAGNTIAGNGGPGIVITGTKTLTTTLVGNTIGLRLGATGRFSEKAPNTGDGVLVGGGANATSIGGATLADGNTIAGNAGNGIRIAGTGLVTTTLRFNTIGTAKPDALFLAGLGNGANGVLVEAAGSPVQIRNSTIFSNTLSGVRLQGNTQKVSILDTAFTANGVGQTGDNAKAIALVGTTIGGTDDATKPNHDLNPPNTIRVNQAKQITGRVLTTGVPACLACTIQFFSTNPATRDGQGRDQLAVTNYSITSNGYFTATLPSLPRQLALTATDSSGNTSEFATFLVTSTVAIARFGAKPPSPGPSETIQYTFRVTNTGSIDLADLDLTTKSAKNWTASVQPTPISLRAGPGGVGESKVVTLTLTLPEGTDARVRIPTVDTTYVTVTSKLLPAVTASTSVTTTVIAKFVLKVTPTALNGQGVTTDPDNPVILPYQHILSNTGNLTGTVTLTATTDLFNPLVPENWRTTLDRTAVTLPPGGKPVTVTVRVALPYSGANAGQVAKTTLKVTQTEPLPGRTSFFTDTTTITANRRATIAPSNVGDGAATKLRTFEHTVTNFSNTEAKFKLTASSSLGSVIAFRSKTAGITLGADNTFTLGTSATNNVFSFYIDVTVDQRAQRGDTDVITITLTSDDGTVVGGVQDTINIIQSAVLPRAYLPLTTRSR